MTDFDSLTEHVKAEFMSILNDVIPILEHKDPLASFISTMILYKVAKEQLLRDPRIKDVNQTLMAIQQIVDPLAELLMRDFADKMWSNRKR